MQTTNPLVTDNQTKKTWHAPQCTKKAWQTPQFVALSLSATKGGQLFTFNESLLGTISTS
jgi:hypothetical protein